MNELEQKAFDNDKRVGDIENTMQQHILQYRINRKREVISFNRQATMGDSSNGQRRMRYVASPLDDLSHIGNIITPHSMLIRF